MRDVVHGVSPERETAPVEAACRACGAPAPGGSACAGCGRLQPFPPGTDHWTVLGLPRRLALDAEDLERRFHALSRRLHPDYFRLRSPEEQAVSLDNAAAVNGAYRALRDPVTRAEALLALEGVAIGAGTPPADLFEELLEVQELRQELAAAPAGEAETLRGRLEAVREELESRRARGEADLLGLFPRWDAGEAVARAGLLGRMRDILATRAYLRTVLRDLDATLAGGTAAGIEVGAEAGRERAR